MKSCLIIEDSKIVRMLLRRIVERFGFTCEEAENGQIAYDMCVKKMPDIAIVDQMMPVMNGTDFLTKLKALKPAKLPQIIFCSANTDIAKIKSTLDAGADEYILKPFDNEIIRAKFKILGLLPPGDA